MATNITSVVVVSAVFLALAGCNESPNPPAATTEPKKEAAAPPQPVTAKTAYYKMYRPVRDWAPDLVTLTVTPEEIPEMKSEDGKYGKWIAVFLSPGKRQVRTVYFTSINTGNLIKGVTMTPAEQFVPGGPNTPFVNSAFSIDSDAAYKTAYGKAKDWVDKHPDKKLAMLLSQPHRYSNPVWYFIWGDRKLGYEALVNASNGELIGGKK